MYRRIAKEKGVENVHTDTIETADVLVHRLDALNSIEHGARP